MEFLRFAGFLRFFKVYRIDRVYRNYRIFWVHRILGFRDFCGLWFSVFAFRVLGFRVCGSESLHPKRLQKGCRP